jgi:sec-independent protein translocase protein TatA
MNCVLAFLPGIGPYEMMFVGFIALLLFGKKLPEVARSLGKGMTEFKRGMQGIQDEIRDATSPVTNAYRELPSSAETVAPQAPKFEPPSESPATSESAQLESLAEVERKQNAASD